MSKLFSSYQLKSMELKNRIVMAPMCMYSADEDGYANDWHLAHYMTRAVGGVGLILLEATAVESRGRITDHDLGLWKDEQIDGLKRIVASCKSAGAAMGVQLAHAGRKSTVLSMPSIAPSPIAFSDSYREPVEMSNKDIQEVIIAFREAAGRAEQAGFDVIELHAAHGYLINEFLSPLTNQRQDAYGGSAVNRVRFLKEILSEVRSVWPKEKPIIVRVSAEDFEEGGNDSTMVAELLNLAKEDGIDLVNVSSGGVINKGVPVFPGYQIRYAETIQRETQLPVIAGGLITSASMAEEVLQNGRADLIFLGRELLRNPYWAYQAAQELRDEISWPVPYERAAKR